MADRNLCGFTLGEFTLREQIGEGVYRGEQELLRREVIVKVLHQRHDDDAPQGFLREAQLDHPYAAHVYARGAKGEDGWIAAELVQGVMLQHWLQKHGPMPREQFVPFFECIAEVVQHAHERGIVHGGLKPSSIMVIKGSDRLFPKLLGFGIDRLTRSDAGMNSPAYMAPEQRSSGDTVGRAADIYALGVIGYETLTGRVPFAAETLDEDDQHRRDVPMPALGGDFSPDFDRILQRALAKEPDARHGSALELASALRVALRASRREQIRSASQQWEDRGRPPGLLWGDDVLAELAPSTRASWSGLSKVERAFIAASLRRAWRRRWGRRSLVAIAATAVVAAVVYWAVTKVWTAEQLVTQAEFERGRSALLHGEPEAGHHLAEAYQRDHSPRIAFTLARALQSRLVRPVR